MILQSASFGCDSQSSVWWVQVQSQSVFALIDGPQPGPAWPPLPSPQPPPVHPTPIHPDSHGAACILCLANTSIPTQYVSGLLLSLRLRFTTMWDWFIYISVFFVFFFVFFARPDRSSPSAYSVFRKERLCEPKTITTRRSWDCFLRRGLCRQAHNKVSVELNKVSGAIFTRWFTHGVCWILFHDLK